MNLRLVFCLLALFVFVAIMSMKSSSTAGTFTFVSNEYLTPSVADQNACVTTTTPLSACSWPSGAPPNGNTLFAIAMTNNTDTITPPSGWSTIYAANNVAGDCYMSVGIYDKIANGEGSSETWASSATGVNLSVTQVSIANGSGVLPLPYGQACDTTSPLFSGTVTPTATGSLVLGAFAASAGVSGLSTASGYNQLAESNLTGYQTMVEASNGLTTSVSTPIPAISTTVTGTYGQGNGFQVVIAPATAYTATPTPAPTATPTTTATPFPQAYEAQPPAYAQNLTGQGSQIITATLTSTPAPNDMLALLYFGPIYETSGGPTLSGTISSTSWTLLKPITNSAYAEVILVKCASASEGTSVGIKNNSSTNTPSHAVLVDIANAQGCGGGVATPNPTPIPLATQAGYDFVNRLMVSPTLPAISAGTYVLQGFDINGLEGIYYPQGTIDSVSSIYSWANGQANGTPVGGETLQSIVNSSGTATFSDFGWYHTVYPTSIASGEQVHAFLSQLNQSCSGSQCNENIEAIVIPPGSALVSPSPLPSPILTQAATTNSFLYKWGVDTHMSFQDSGGGAFFHYLKNPAPNGNTVAVETSAGIAAGGRVILADGVFHHLRDGINHGEQNTWDGTSLCSIYQNYIRTYGLDFETGINLFDGADFTNIPGQLPQFLQWEYEYNCFTSNGAYPLQLFGFEGGPNENNGPGDGQYWNGLNTGATSAPYVSGVPTSTPYPIQAVTPFALATSWPVPSPSPTGAQCPSNGGAYNSPSGDGAFNGAVYPFYNASVNNSINSFKDCTSSTWAEQMVMVQQQIYSARSTSSNPHASPFPSTVRILAGPVIGGDGSDNTDFEIFGNTLLCPSAPATPAVAPTPAYGSIQRAALPPANGTLCTGGAPLGSYTEYSNVHGYGYGGEGNGDNVTSGGRSGLHNTMIDTQLYTGVPSGSATPQPTIITETGISNSPEYNAGVWVDVGTQSKYELRQFLQLQLDAPYGAYSAYIYDLAMENRFAYFSLFDEFLNPTPAYTNLRDVSSILTDTLDTFPSSTFTPGSLAYYVDGTSDIKSVLLQKYDGSFWLVLWKNDASFSLSTEVAIPVPNTPTNVRFGSAYSNYTAWYMNPNNGVVTMTPLSGGGTAQTTVNISDMPVILQIGSGSEPSPAPPTPQAPVCPAAFAPAVTPPPTGSGYAPFCSATPGPTWVPSTPGP